MKNKKPHWLDKKCNNIGWIKNAPQSSPLRAFEVQHVLSK